LNSIQPIVFAADYANRYKLIGFVFSAIVVAIAGTLSVFNHRETS
jgi:ABC-type branched-subunit amino acid transport system permease subunit